MTSFIAHICPDVRHDCEDRVGEACGFHGWKPGETPGTFCKNYRRCLSTVKQEVEA